ncbi:MAG: Clp protease ClpP, partial [Acidobacteriota bacterium]
GGDVFAAVTIANALRRHKARVIVHVDGLCASAASYIAHRVAKEGDLRVHSDSAVMIHEPYTFGIFSASDLDAEDGQGDLLRQLSEIYFEAYKGRWSGSDDELRGAMASESWYFGARAVEAGMADLVMTDATFQARHRAKDLPFSKPPASVRALYSRKTEASMPNKPVAGTPPADPQNSDPTTPEPAPTTPAASASRVNPNPSPAPSPEAPAATASGFDFFALAQGGNPANFNAAVQAAIDKAASARVQEVEKTLLDDLDARALASRTARVDALVLAGKIPPAERDHVLEVLAALPAKLQESHLVAIEARSSMTDGLDQEFVVDLGDTTASVDMSDYSGGPSGADAGGMQMVALARARAEEVSGGDPAKYAAAYRRELLKVGREAGR